jgi:TonB-dependent SusC/RagA subfamily outer membrane receptor
LAQSKATSSKDTLGKWSFRDTRSLANPTKPLIILDDSIYTGDIKNIDPKEILSVDILKDHNATAIYGSQAALGAIIVKTKKYRKTDTTNKAKPLDSVVNKDALFVIDGQPSKNKLNNVDPDDILSIDIIKKDKASEYFEGDASNGVVVIITKAGAIKNYQKKFSAFSKKYESYLENHQNKDDDFLYVLDGVPVQGKRNDVIKTLYEIPSRTIKEIGFNEKQPGHGSATMVIINTKQ